MKIGFVIPSMKLGGSATVVYNILMEMDDKENDISLIVFFNQFAERYSALKQKRIRILFLNKRSTIDLAFEQNLKQVIKKERFDAISSHETATFYLRNKIDYSKTKVFHTIHADPEKDLPRLYRLLMKRRIALGKIHLIACSNSIGELTKNVYGVSPTVIPNGIPLTADMEPKTRRTNEPFVFLTIARFDSVKNIPDLIAAFFRMLEVCPEANSELWICGDGESKTEYEDLAHHSEHGSNVRFFPGDTNIDALYRRADCFCLFSSREGGPITILESLVYGLPIVASDIPGVKNYAAPGENALLFPVHDIDAAAKQMHKLYQNSKMCLDMSKRNREKAKLFSAKAMAKQYLTLFQKD